MEAEQYARPAQMRPQRCEHQVPTLAMPQTMHVTVQNGAHFLGLLSVFSSGQCVSHSEVIDSLCFSFFGDYCVRPPPIFPPSYLPFSHVLTFT